MIWYIRFIIYDISDLLYMIYQIYYIWHDEINYINCVERIWTEIFSLSRRWSLFRKDFWPEHEHEWCSAQWFHKALDFLLFQSLIMALSVSIVDCRFSKFYKNQTFFWRWYTRLNSNLSSIYIKFGCLFACLSDHNSGTPGSICLKLWLENSGGLRECSWV